jgi:hypothetical protein
MCIYKGHIYVIPILIKRFINLFFIMCWTGLNMVFCREFLLLISENKYFHSNWFFSLWEVWKFMWMMGIVCTESTTIVFCSNMYIYTHQPIVLAPPPPHPPFKHRLKESRNTETEGSLNFLFWHGCVFCQMKLNNTTSCQLKFQYWHFNLYKRGVAYVDIDHIILIQQ